MRPCESRGRRVKKTCQWQVFSQSREQSTIAVWLRQEVKSRRGLKSPTIFSKKIKAPSFGAFMVVDDKIYETGNKS